MSGARDTLASVAEFSLWVAAAALIAGAAGMRLPAGLLAPSTPAPMASVPGGPGPLAAASPSAVPTLAPAPTPVPTLSPLVARFQANLARKDFQFQATGTESLSYASAGQSQDVVAAISINYKAGDEADTSKLTAAGQTSVRDSVNTGTHDYERVNGGPWIDKPRPKTDRASSLAMFSPKRLFVDTGVETKNDKRLHRLEAADPGGFSAEMATLQSATDVHLTLTFWTNDAGVPAAFRMDGTLQISVRGVEIRETIAQELTFNKLSGVSIAAPKKPWKWIVDGLDAFAFGLPSNWKSSGVNRLLGLTTYTDATHYTFGYVTDSAGLNSLDTAANQIITQVAEPVEGRKATTVAGQPAVQFGVHRTKQKDYLSETVVLCGGKVYQFVFLGAAGDAAIEAMAAQILGTIAFTA
jgi:hypothetical protein